METLKADPKAVPLPYAVGTVRLEGREYVEDCTCWHKRALQIMEFLEGHAHQVAQYLNDSREKAIRDAMEMPIVGEEQ